MIHRRGDQAGGLSGLGIEQHLPTPQPREPKIPLGRWLPPGKGFIFPALGGIWRTWAGKVSGQSSGPWSNEVWRASSRVYEGPRTLVSWALGPNRVAGVCLQPRLRGSGAVALRSVKTLLQVTESWLGRACWQPHPLPHSFALSRALPGAARDRVSPLSRRIHGSLFSGSLSGPCSASGPGVHSTLTRLGLWSSRAVSGQF